MRKIKFIIIVFFILTRSNVFGQVMPENNKTIKLTGIWYVVNTWPAVKDTLVFNRKSKVPNNYGDGIKISENGEIIDFYSAPCGNDTRIHSTKGSWTFEKNESIIVTSIPIYLDRTKNKIIELNSDTLVLVRLE